MIAAGEFRTAGADLLIASGLDTEEAASAGAADVGSGRVGLSGWHLRRAPPPVGKADRARHVAFSDGEDVEVVRVLHDAQHVAERVDHRRGDEPLVPVRSDRLVLRGPHRQQPLDGGVEVVDAPVHDRAAGPGRRAGRRVPAVDDAQLGLVVADAELGVGRAPVGARAHEVRLEPEEVRVPGGGRRHVVRPDVQCGESSQAHQVSLVDVVGGDAIGDCGRSASAMTGGSRTGVRAGPQLSSRVVAAVASHERRGTAWKRRTRRSRTTV